MFSHTTSWPQTHVHPLPRYHLLEHLKLAQGEVWPLKWFPHSCASRMDSWNYCTPRSPSYRLYFLTLGIHRMDSVELYTELHLQTPFPHLQSKLNEFISEADELCNCLCGTEIFWLKVRLVQTQVPTGWTSDTHARTHTRTHTHTHTLTSSPL